MPVTWEEVEGGVRVEDFRIDNALERLNEVGDLWKPVLAKTKRFDLYSVYEAARPKAKAKKKAAASK